MKCRWRSSASAAALAVAAAIVMPLSITSLQASSFVLGTLLSGLCGSRGSFAPGQEDPSNLCTGCQAIRALQVEVGSKVIP